MSTYELILPWAWPLLVSLTMLVGGASMPAGVRHALTYTAAVPGLCAALFLAPGDQAYLPALLIGMQLDMTTTAQLFLLFTSVLWLLTSIYAVGYMKEDRHASSFFMFYHACLAGNTGLILAGDIPSFYAFFAIMTFAGYGLVVHNRDESSRRAGRIYLSMAVIGEALVLSAFLLIAFEGQSMFIREARFAIPDSPHATLIMTLVLLGFGVKAGLAGLHMWLPLAHPVAPTPASAVLSGAMIKAGLIGWLYFLPGGLGAWPDFSWLCIALGFTGAFGAVAIGWMQRDPKTILAYSSVSQMGVMLIAVGIGLSQQQAWPAITILLCVYAANHAYAKGALFLGVGVAGSVAKQRHLHGVVLSGLILAALAISGAPLTGGALAKSTLKYTAPSAVAYGLILSSIATTLLLARFLLIIRGRMLEDKHKPHAGIFIPWLILLAFMLVSPWIVIPAFRLETIQLAPSLAGIGKAAWPVLTGILLIGLWRKQASRADKMPRIPAGDLCLFFEQAAHRIARAWMHYVAAPMEKKREELIEAVIRRIMPENEESTVMHHAELRLRDMSASGALFLLLISIMILILMMGATP
jgi:formate hydrogenlyase subunit 3/multisubunit Na+/H+ antiporter MnhD subunit